ncbi:hypothetical protein TELCIR_26038, partial [Teladorsagia circumcincta]
CSSRWPNVFEGEADPLKYTKQWPFPGYCSSKYEAEEMIHRAPINAYIIDMFLKTINCQNERLGGAILWVAPMRARVPYNKATSQVLPRHWIKHFTYQGCNGLHSYSGSV